MERDLKDFNPEKIDAPFYSSLPMTLTAEEEELSNIIYSFMVNTAFGLKNHFASFTTSTFTKETKFDIPFCKDMFTWLQTTGEITIPDTLGSTYVGYIITIQEERFKEILKRAFELFRYSYERSSEICCMEYINSRDITILYDVKFTKIDIEHKVLSGKVILWTANLDWRD